MRKVIIAGALSVILTGNVWAQTPVYLDETKPVEDRIEDALKRMTLEEKWAAGRAFRSSG